MDFGSLDLGTWRLVGFVLFGIGALATVLAIIAIIVMFRGGKTNVSSQRARSDRDDFEDDSDEDHDEDHDDGADEDDVDEDVGPYRGNPRTESATPSRIRTGDVRDRDGGPASPPVGLSDFSGNLFAEPTNVPAPRQPIRVTRDEPHVPSPDWYTYPDVVDPEPAVDDAAENPFAPFAKARHAEPPPTPPVLAPASAGEPRRPSRAWYDDAPEAGEVSSTPPARQPDTRSTPAAVQPANFPWAQATAASAVPAPAQSPAPEREGAQRPRDERYDESADSDSERVPAEPTATARHSETRSAATIPVAPDTVAPNHRSDSGPIDVTSNASARHAETRSAATDSAVRAPAVQAPAVPTPPVPDLPVNQDPDAPAADWYDDPDGSGGERWWDGRGWTKHRRVRSEAQPDDSGRQRTSASRPPAGTIELGGGLWAVPSTTPSDGPPGDQAPPRAPGWYRDPSGSGGRRFWDGSQWTSGV